MTTVSGKRAEDLIKSKDGKYRLFFIGASWCSACLEMKIQVSMAAQQLDDVQTYRISFDKDEALCEKYIDEAIPFLMLVKNGRVLDSIEGLDDSDAIIAMVDQIVGD